MKLVNQKIIWAIVCIFTIIHTVSCQKKTEKMKWTYINFDKLPTEKDYHGFDALTQYKFNQILTYNKDVFFLLGDDSKETGDSAVSVIYRTKDFGGTWDKASLGKGRIREGVFAGNNLFVVLENNDRPHIYSSALYLSTNLGDTWQEVQIFEGANISNLNFYSKNTGTLFQEKKIEDTWQNEYLYTLDGGEIWNVLEIEGMEASGSNFLFRSETEFLYLNSNQLFRYNLKAKEKTLIKNLAVPKGMKSEYVGIDKKTGELFTFFYNPKDEDESGIYYLERNEYVILPKGYRVATYGDYYYGLLYDRPFSTYVWSSDRGKTWNEEKLDNFISAYTPIGYYGEGYVYTTAGIFRNIEDRGPHFIIGHPIK